MRIVLVLLVLSCVLNVLRGYERAVYKDALEKTVSVEPKVDPKKTFSALGRAEHALEGVKEFSLTSEGKTIITNVRAYHTVPALIPEENFGEGLCAGYLYELTARMWGADVPYKIGMMHPKTKMPADARELPYTYRYKGGALPIEVDVAIGQQIKKDPRVYPESISSDRLKEFFMHAFDEKSYFGDIGFLYANTTVRHMLGRFNNFNSHVGKNFGRSMFTVPIASPDDRLAQTIKNSLGCSDAMRLRVKPLLPYYQRSVNEVAVDLIQQEKDMVFIEKRSGMPVVLSPLDVLAYDDVTIAHFFNGPHVDSLLQMTCQGEFYPVNVLQINPVFLEVM